MNHQRKRIVFIECLLSATLLGALVFWGAGLRRAAARDAQAPGASGNAAVAVEGGDASAAGGLVAVAGGDASATGMGAQTSAASGGASYVVSASAKAYLECVHYDERGFLKAIENAAPYPIEGKLLAAVSPHFLPVMSYTANIMSSLAREGQPERVIFVLAPNHSGESLPVILADRGWSTPYGYLDTDEDVIDTIRNAPELASRIDVNQAFMESDHSAATLMPFIKYYMPQAKVVTLLLGRDCSLAPLRAIADIIYETGKSKPVFLLASVDFSHGLRIGETPERDAVSEALIRAGDTQTIKKLDSGNMDSPESVITTLYYVSRFPGARVDRPEHVVLAESDIKRDIGYSYCSYVFSAGVDSAAGSAGGSISGSTVSSAVGSTGGAAGSSAVSSTDSSMAGSAASSAVGSAGGAAADSASKAGGLARRVILDGSTANIPLAQTLVQRYYGLTPEEAEAEIQFHRTSASYRYLVEKSADMLLVNIADRETKEYLDHVGAKLEYYPLRRDALCFIINERNPLKGITTGDVKDIYQGRISNWRRLGGNDNEIVAYHRNEDSGSQALMRELVMGSQEMKKAPPELVPAEMAQLLDALATHNTDGKAIGYCTYYYASTMYARSGLKFLAIDGVSPNNETISKGIYPFINEYSIVIRADEPQGSPTRDLLAWLLSDAGSKLVEDLGYVPAR